MTTPYYTDYSIILHHGDALDVLRGMPSESVNCVVTSPPYFGLRDYGVDGQLGVEKTPAEYVEALRAVFAEVRRVLANDGTCWLNLGDTYSSRGPGEEARTGVSSKVGAARANVQRRAGQFDRPPKNLLGIPWRVAFALQDDGWILRRDIIWAKRNFMPEAVTDRPTSAHEYIFMFTKKPRYWYDAEAIREESDPDQEDHNRRYAKEYTAHSDRAVATGQPGNVNNVGIHSRPGRGGRNARSVWTVSSVPFTGARIARLHPDHHGLDEPSYGMRRIASPTCPLHASVDRQGSSGPDDGHAVTPSSGTPDIGIRPVPTRADGFAPIQSPAEQSSVPSRSDSLVLDSSGSARSRSNGNRRKVRDPATSQPCTPSARTQSGTEHIEGQYGFDLPDLHISESSKAADGLVDRVGIASSKHDKCSCSWANDTGKVDHFASFPPELPRRCILAGCPEGGTVLDPFHGSGTTGMVAQQHGRRYVGIELNAEYLELSLRTRLRNAALPFGGESA